MTDQEMQAIRVMFKEETAAIMKDVNEKLTEAKKDIMQGVAVLMDAEFKPKFDLLAEEIQSIHEELHTLSEKVDRIEDKVTDHEIKLKIIN